MYRIWSFEHRAWWKPNGRGYTGSITEAGIYPEEEAEEIVRNANKFLPEGKVNEEMRPVPTEPVLTIDRDKVEAKIATYRAEDLRGDDEWSIYNRGRADALIQLVSDVNKGEI